MPRETIRYDADTIWIRYGYGATRYDTLVRDNDGSLPPDRVREPIKLHLLVGTGLGEGTWAYTHPRTLNGVLWS